MNSHLSNIISHTKVKLSRQITNTPEDELLRSIDNKKKYTPELLPSSFRPKLIPANFKLYFFYPEGKLN